jgi:molecular chaperone IbpA
MTHQNSSATIYGPLFKDFDKLFVGFDGQFNRLVKMHDELAKNIPNYPPYNIRKTGENVYTIEIAVAGFAKSQIDIEIDGDKLIVRGNAAEDDSNDYMFKGIAQRAFTRTFALNDQVVVRGASMINGMLKVALERILPVQKQPRRIEVEDGDVPKGKRTLLQE